MESVESPPMNSDQFNRNKQRDSLRLNPENTHNRMPIDNVRARAQTRSKTRNDNILNSGVQTRSMVAESPRGLFTSASVRNTVSNITDSVRRGLNQLDTFYNPSISREEENTAMIARCLYYGPTKKTFDWLTKFEDKESFGFWIGYSGTIRPDHTN